VKDGINEYIVSGRRNVVNPDGTGTKVAAHYRLTIPAGQSKSISLRLTPTEPDALEPTYGKRQGAFGKHFGDVFASPHPGSGRVLFERHSQVPRRGRHERDASSPGRDALVQAVLLL
jgi:hypothetical protein